MLNTFINYHNWNLIDQLLETVDSIQSSNYYWLHFVLNQIFDPKTSKFHVMRRHYYLVDWAIEVRMLSMRVDDVTKALAFCCCNLMASLTVGVEFEAGWGLLEWLLFFDWTLTIQLPLVVLSHLNL